jgi:hypothetical protein
MVVAYTPFQSEGGTQQVNKQKVVGKVGKFNICFRQEHLTSHAGTVLLQDFACRLGVERVLDEELQVKVRERGYSEGQAIRGLVYNLILGGVHLRDLEVLRGDLGTQELFAHIGYQMKIAHLSNASDGFLRSICVASSLFRYEPSC